MHNLLSKYLEKLKIKNVTELEPEEQKVYEEWEKVLSKEELSIKDFKQFCEAQVGAIEAKWKDLNLEQSKKAELIPYHTVYKTLLAVVDGPKAAREALENSLQQLINQ
jgi:hypothetical protein